MNADTLDQLTEALDRRPGRASNQDLFPPKPEKPLSAGSWWLGLDRARFYAKAREREAEIERSRTSAKRVDYAGA